MVYRFRGQVVFEYNVDNGKVIQHKVEGIDSLYAFDFCRFIDEDYRLMSLFFDRVYHHRKGLEVDLSDIIVN